ncbi:Gfo/Idh/MocA family oxidoreductase [Micromonospora sp. WMMD1128]|uniref:Gfo/Idh/MocA family protein n=1 Tax=unclassified Micromonospora TaxID=2617518 RepID=UPI00248BEF99|nr:MULTISPECIES: Gfo/Idh/MocA family oxidoreductase [unclassified Micromonospora]WBB73900.1 Gfo/Idh/MocA family oxidoreductase [Micromonospora sp. WMMD1128]WFE32693.1 Gfo/Idh/MocA family oxidoreductase [Micromonospora sp. WMMD975]
MRLGIVGTGRWGSRYVETVGRMWPEGEVLISEVAGRRDSPGALIRSAAVDGIIVAAPAATHYAITMEALDAGVPVLVEKPLAPTLSETLAIRDRAEARGSTVMVGHQHLHAPAFRELRERVAGRAVSTISGTFGGDGPVRADCDVLWDYGPHDFAMALDLLGDQGPVTREYARCEVPAPGRQDWDVGVRVGGTPVRFRFTNAATARHHRFRVRLSDGGEYRYDDFAPHRLTLDDVPIDVADTLPLDNQIRAFVAAVRGDNVPSRTSDLALAVRVAEALTRLSATPAGTDA